jgi:hypothetical protein
MRPASGTSSSAGSRSTPTVSSVLRGTLDIVPDPDPDNLRRLAQLLANLKARHVGLGDFPPDEFPFDPTRAEDRRRCVNDRAALACNVIRALLGTDGLDNHQPPRRPG